MEPLDLVSLISRTLQVSERAPYLDEIKREVGIDEEVLNELFGNIPGGGLCSPVYDKDVKVYEVSYRDPTVLEPEVYVASEVCLANIKKGLALYFKLRDRSKGVHVLILPRKATLLELYASYKTLEANAELVDEFLKDLLERTERAERISKEAEELVEILQEAVRTLRERRTRGKE